MRSEMRLADWYGDLTLFHGFYGTRPTTVLKNVSLMDIVANIAPFDGPAVVANKKTAPYFVPCALRDAPLVNGTRAKAEILGLPLIGMQRSAAHVTVARMVVADLDGITLAQLFAILNRLKAAGVTFLLYSTHSHGRPDKPGVRCRLLFPVDLSLDSVQYKHAASGANVLFFDGLADVSGFALHQQQGVWATAPEREHLAFRRIHRAGVASAAALVAAVPKVETPKRGSVLAAFSGPGMFDMQRVVDALEWLDPNQYQSWLSTAIYLKAAYGDAAYPAWLAWGDTADEKHKVMNNGECAPDKVWGEIEPRMPSGAGSGTLFAHARDNAVEAVRNASAIGRWDQHAQVALVYLRRYHSRLYADLFEVAT